MVLQGCIIDPLQVAFVHLIELGKVLEAALLGSNLTRLFFMLCGNKLVEQLNFLVLEIVN